MEKWLDDVESELKVPYTSSDLVVLNNLLKKQEELEEGVIAHRDRLQVLVDTAREFQQERHFLADELEERVDQVVHRCASVCHFTSVLSTPTFYCPFPPLHLFFSPFLFVFLSFSS